MKYLQTHCRIPIYFIIINIALRRTPLLETHLAWYESVTYNSLLKRCFFWLNTLKVIFFAEFKVKSSLLERTQNSKI